MSQVCKRCNLSKPLTDYQIRRWKGPGGLPKEGPRKVCKACENEVQRLHYATPGYARRAGRLARYAANADAERARNRAYYQAHREKWLDPTNGWRFSERARQYDEQYRQQPEVIAAAQQRGAKWRAENKAKNVAKTRRRQKHVARATPSWADHEAILAIYKQAEQLTKTTGERHEVDHVIPLGGKLVCGLHVETNLRVITATHNRRKGHKFKPATSLSPAAAG